MISVYLYFFKDGYKLLKCECYVTRCNNYCFPSGNLVGNTAKNAVISPNFLMWTFSGKTVSAQFLYGNCAFPQNVLAGKLGEITVFTQ